MTRPRRQRKGDRLLSPDAARSAVMIDHAIAPLDRLAEEMDVQWGIDRLAGLVAPSTASKYGGAIASLNEAIDSGDAEAAIKWAGVCMRGLAAMDAEARSHGHAPADPEVWEYEMGETRYGLHRDGADWKAIRERRPDLELVSLREAMIALAEKRATPPDARPILEDRR